MVPVVAATFPTRRSYLLLALLAMGFAVYGSLIPFDVRRVPLAEAWAQFREGILSAPPARYSRSDVLANFLLFVPVGFSLAGAVLLERGRAALLLAPFVIFPASLAASAVAEFVQIFTSDRVSSNLDIATQTVGTLVGVVAWLLIGTSLTRWIRDTLAASGDDRLARVLAGYAFAWIFVNLAPFDITVDVGDLGRRLREGRISLVAAGSGEASLARFVWDALAEFLAAIPLGVLGASRWGRRRARSFVEAFGIGALIVAAVEAAQIFIRSHSATVSDVIFGWAGVTVGVIVGARTLARLRPGESSDGSTTAATPLLAGFVVWCVVIAAYHWQPYDFAVDADLIRRKLARMSLIPFAGYQAGSAINALNDLLTKLALSMPLGVLASFAFAGGPPRRLAVAAWLLAAGVLFAVVEAGQFFLPSRVPDPTDVVVGLTGAALGLALGRWLRSNPPPPGRERGSDVQL